MADIAVFTFNLFEENTYVVWDETGECLILDPGCYDPEEETLLRNFIEAQNLRPVRLLNTHCHVDHACGNAFVEKTWGLRPEFHSGEQVILDDMPRTAAMYGTTVAPSPPPARYIEDGEEIRFGNTTLKALLTPGHSPASLSFFCEQDGFVLSGDVLFAGAIGRWDFRGGDYNTLIASIRERLFPLSDEVRVYPGHNEATTIGREKMTNPYFRE